jgi:hypothetical protein
MLIRGLTVTLGAIIAASIAPAQTSQTPRTPKASAPIDLTGMWVSLVTEDWRYRMVTPTKGDYYAVPMKPESRLIADAWDPRADEAAGNQCKSYGAPAFMRLAARFRFSWEGEKTLKVESDSGMQTRLFHFEASAAPGMRTWQGSTVVQWERPNPGRGNTVIEQPPGGWLKAVTNNLRSGYLRKNGVPYSEDAVLTEYFDIAARSTGPILVVTAIIEDPKYLNQPFVVSSQFRKEVDGSKWDPTPCSATW